MTSGSSGWRRYDNTLFPVFHERFEEKWGEGTAPFLDPSVYDEDQPRPRAQWINVDTGAAVAVVPVGKRTPLPAPSRSSTSPRTAGSGCSARRA